MSTAETTESSDRNERNVQGLRVPGYGACIYCGADGGSDGLTDEHVIPLSLNGDLVIKDACCETCRRKTHAADTHLARHVFLRYRYRTGAKTRNPKSRPDTIKCEFEIDGIRETRALPLADAPFSMFWPVWGDAGLLSGRSLDDPFPEVLWHMYHSYPQDLSAKLGSTKGRKWMYSHLSRVNPVLFARALLKIAYCQLVIDYGIDGFCKMGVPQTILACVPAFHTCWWSIR